MSLQVWLPLLGNINNQGISDYQFINRNVTFSNDGKLGQCAEFNGSNACLYVDDVNLGNTWSYSLWFYHYTRDVGWRIIVMLNETGGDADTQFSFWYNNNENRLQSTANKQYTSTIPAPTKDAWHHFCATFNGTKLLTYLDGVLVNTRTITNEYTPKTHLTIGASRSGATAWNNYWKGKINDFRLYDECLSPLQVKQISQGLMLHYQLDTGGSLCKTDLSKWSKESGVTATTQTDGSVKIDCTTKTNSRWGIYYDIQNILPNTQYTFTIECKIANTAKPFYMSIGCNPVPSGTSQFGTNRATMMDINGFTKYTVTVKTNSDTTWIRFYLACYGSTTNQEYQYAFVKNVNMTIGSEIDNVISDSSGYRYDGVIEGTLTTSTNTVRYKKSIIFDGLQSKIRVPNLTPTELTVSFWLKRGANTGTRQFLYTAWNGITCELTTDGKPTFAVYRSNYPTIQGNAITTSNNWVHYCATFDLTNGSKLYQNGILVASNNNVTPITYNLSTNYIGYYNNNYYNGQMSDFRIYATALSADDIKYLYETSMMIDSSGNILPRVLTF